MSSSSARTCLFALLLLSSCGITRPSSIPTEPDHILVVKSMRIPDRYPFPSRFARHSWFEAKKGDEESWVRLQVPRTGVPEIWPVDAEQARKDIREGRKVQVLRVYTGEEARRITAEIEAVLTEEAPGWSYRYWPGPNSNTFVARAARRIPGLAFELDHNSIGQDYTPVLRAGPTLSKTGLAVDTPVLGFAAGLREGLELHLLQFSFGFSFFPPAIEIPFLPRLGFPLWPLRER